MAIYEYKVVPAPAKGEKSRGIKGPEGRFAHAVERLMNEMAAEGWEYQRAETLPSEERSGLTSSQTVWRNLLVFRRLRAADAAEVADDAEEPASEAPPAAAREDMDESASVSAEEPDDEEDGDDLFRFTYQSVSGTAPQSAPLRDGPSSVLADRAARLRQESAAE